MAPAGVRPMNTNVGFSFYVVYGWQPAALEQSAARDTLPRALVWLRLASDPPQVPLSASVRLTVVLT